MKHHSRWAAAVVAAAAYWSVIAPLHAQRPPVPFGPRPGEAPQAAAPGGRPAAVQSPDWYPLPEPHQEYLDQVLQYWEHRSNQVKRYRCQFKRWEYDPVFGPKNTFSTYSEGAIQYSAPDKGMFKVEKIMHYTPPEKPGEQPNYVERPDEHGEHWICDGKSIFEHDYQKKQLIERQLPPHLHGQAISDGPLPFLFGADGDKIKQRYWVRVITPRDVKGEYWLEAYPKTQQDAANFKMVHVIIDEKDYLPKGIVLFDRSFDPRTKPARTTFEFVGREVNWNLLAQKLNLWHREFFEPKLPGKDWKKVVERFQPGPPDRPPERLDQARRPPR